MDKIREQMAKAHIDTRIVTGHGVKPLSGFTGSAGTLVVTPTHAGLWTDGRYMIQAAAEMEGSGIALYDVAESDFITFAAKETPAGGCIAFDGRALSAAAGQKLRAKVKHKNIRLAAESNSAGSEQGLPAAPLYDYDVKYCGIPRGVKLRQLREKMAESGADAVVIAAPDDIAWLLNLRGSEMPFSPCFAAFALVEASRAVLFVDQAKAAGVAALLAADGVTIRDYADVYVFLSTISGHVFIDPESAGYAILTALEAAAGVSVTERTPCFAAAQKAVKNATELANIERANIRDGVIMARFIKWLKETVARRPLTEWDAQEKLLRLRQSAENFVMPSFNTITAYMANAAMMHYAPRESDCAIIRPAGFLLIDSGAHYRDGTTDMTRTIALGPLTDQMITDFTLVLQSHIALARAAFLHGATGSNLDTIARLPLWVHGLDYKSGTGHGIGFFTCVHEGPQRISQRPSAVKIEPGMITTNEPGIYRPGAYGIRTENTMRVIPHRETEFGKFLRFSVLSYCPIDLAALNTAMLSGDERQWLNDYHQTVFHKLCPHMDEGEIAWLKHETRPLGLF